MYDATLRKLFNRLVPELSGQCIVRETKGLHGHLLICMFLADDFTWCYFFQHHTAHQLKSSLSARGFLL